MAAKKKEKIITHQEELIPGRLYDITKKEDPTVHPLYDCEAQARRVVAGETFKSQKELCEFLGLKYPANSTARQVQYEELKNLFDLTREGNALQVGKSFDEVTFHLVASGVLQSKEFLQECLFAVYDWACDEVLPGWDFGLDGAFYVRVTNSRLSEAIFMVETKLFYEPQGWEHLRDAEYYDKNEWTHDVIKPLWKQVQKNITKRRQNVCDSIKRQLTKSRLFPFRSRVVLSATAAEVKGTKEHKERVAALKEHLRSKKSEQSYLPVEYEDLWTPAKEQARLLTGIASKSQAHKFGKSDVFKEAITKACLLQGIPEEIELDEHDVIAVTPVAMNYVKSDFAKAKGDERRAKLRSIWEAELGRFQGHSRGFVSAVWGTMTGREEERDRNEDTMMNEKAEGMYEAARG